MYLRWPAVVAGVAICPIQLPGRENRIGEPHFGGFDALAEAAGAGLAPFLDRPFAFFGHCAGALMAYQTTVRLASLGLMMPTRLFVSSQSSPQMPTASGFVTMNENELRAELARLFTDMGGRPTADMLDLCLSVYRLDLAAARAFRSTLPVPPPTGLTVISWADSGVSEGSLDGWSDYGDVIREDLPGDHYRFLAAPADLLHVLTAWPGSPDRPLSSP
jgi:surfactin synthase thioesterase subunit